MIAYVLEEAPVADLFVMAPTFLEVWRDAA
jgi:hypothetical protein